LKKWWFYPGAMTLMLPRVAVGVYVFTALTVGSSIILFGRDKDSVEPITGVRKALLRALFFTHVHLFGTGTCFSLLRVRFGTLEEVDCYEEYLGEKMKVWDKPISTLVSNHTSWLEVLCLLVSPH
jgi:hypothetical protein